MRVNIVEADDGEGGVSLTVKLNGEERKAITSLYDRPESHSRISMETLINEAIERAGAPKSAGDAPTKRSMKVKWTPADEPLRWSLEIFEQSHFGRDFNNGESKFEASNDITLVSKSHPQWHGSARILYVGGCDLQTGMATDGRVHVTNADKKLIEQAIQEWIEAGE